MYYTTEQYRHILFYGLLILGCIAKGYTKPTSQSTISEDETDMQNDYNEQNDYNDDDTASVPDSPPVISTQKFDPTDLPYFEEKEYLKQAKFGSNITLECPAKNLGASNVILWYKEDKVVAAGSNPVGDRYRFNEIDHSLLIVNVTDNDNGNYYCEVQPQNIRAHVNVGIDDEISSTSPLPLSSEESNANNDHAAEAQSSSNTVIPSTFVLLSICTLLLKFFSRI